MKLKRPMTVTVNKFDGWLNKPLLFYLIVDLYNGLSPKELKKKRRGNNIYPAIDFLVNEGILLKSHNKDNTVHVEFTEKGKDVAKKVFEIISLIEGK